MDTRIVTGVIAGLAGLAVLVGLCGPVSAESLTVGAPPSLRPAFHDILPMFEQEYDAHVNVMYTPSRTLARQVQKGAPIDVFLGAGIDEIEDLYKKKLTLNGKPRVYARTSLVLLMASDSPSRLLSFDEAFDNPKIRIALGDPQTSSLGDITAKELVKLHPAYKSHGNIIYATHSVDIVELIRTRKADVGLVYRVDMINSGQVRISDEAPMGMPVRVDFGQAVVSTCRPPLRPIAEKFSDFLMTSRIQRLLVKYGFQP
ncbi:molybdate ABC transporter substrate-binding protein [Nitrospira sp.]|nr:molybdate ABC transporter substrate-binding protein [Nitrospira sp.]